MFCKKCGSEVIDGAAFCNKCGAKILSSEILVQSEQNSTASNNENCNEVCYDENIKPYYREQFARIALGQKAKFNWAAFFFAPLTQLYNDCTRLFCRTYLPIGVGMLVSYMLLIVATASFNFTLMGIAYFLSNAFCLFAIVFSFVNGFKFNKWYYQDVISNPGKKRTKKWFWIFLGVSVVAWVRYIHLSFV